jgi:hypothetical protein
VIDGDLRWIDFGGEDIHHLAVTEDDIRGLLATRHLNQRTALVERSEWWLCQSAGDRASDFAIGSIPLLAAPLRG